MNFIRIIFYPLVYGYSLAVRIRNLFFDRNIFKARSVESKIISIGNINVGGSGKTPLVIYLAKLLKEKKKKVGVLSRGYMRKTTGYLLVSNGGKILTGVDQCGDEMFHTVSECMVPAAVSESRYKGAKRLIKETGVNVIIMDDGFQHRWIKRDMDILIFDQRFLIEKNFRTRTLLPAGNLREPFNNISRANLVVINRKFSDKSSLPADLKKYFYNKPVFTAHYKAIGFVDMVRQTEYGIEEFEGQKSLVIAGIARPFSFINILKQTKVDTQNRMLFPDHKHYTLKEVQKIRKEFYATNSHSVVTTQKDAVKLLKFKRELDDIDIFYLKIEMVFDEKDKFREFIFNHLN
jgi:tetraacyldisaccharide 4'-kinase